ncbi:MAG TPA: Ig-like domain-containing protein [Actinomycetota bacterium]|nr:Ig-like domain-containing protein [Actinomycetota bacterium]
MATWVAMAGAIALLGGVLQTASAMSLAQVPSFPDTGTTVSANTNPSVVGEEVTYTAKVESTDSVLGTVPVTAGTVDFQEGGSTISGCGARELNASGEATCPAAHGTAGERTIKAFYSGDATSGHQPSESASHVQTVNKAATTTTLTSSDADNTTVSGQSVTYTATVAVVPPGAGTPTGTVKFKNDTTDISSCTLQPLGTPTTGKAQCGTNFMAVDSPHAVSAEFSGDTEFLSSTTETGITQTVNKANTQVGLSSPGPVKTGQQVTYTAAVTVVVPGAGTPTGTVTFKEGSTQICTPVSLSSSGTAQCSTTYNTVGNRSITAEYSGDSNYNLDTSDVWTQVVNYAYTLTATGGSSNATFRISGNPRLPNYRLCVRYFGYQGVEGDWPAATPPPVAAHSGIHMYGINFDNKCKKIAWPSGATSDTDQLLDSPLGGDDFGFAAKGTYEVSWYTCGNGTCSANGALIGKQQFSYSSWCPPNVGGFRQKGVWRTSRHKVIDSCYADTGNPSGLDSHFDKDRSVNMNGMHNEFVARDYLGSYGAPAEALGAQGNGYTSNVRTYVGVKVCDTYHRGKRELHPMFMAQGTGGTIWLGGAHYSTKTPSISGTWKRYAC